MKRQINNLKKLKAKRQELRNNLTPAEASLWTHIKNSQLGVKFRRQHSVGPFILDFYCPAKRLAIELDGAGHFTEDGAAHDKRRTAYLEQYGIRVIRFENEDVFLATDQVLEEIRRRLDE